MELQEDVIEVEVFDFNGGGEFALEGSDEVGRDVGEADGGLVAGDLLVEGVGESEGGGEGLGGGDVEAFDVVLEGIEGAEVGQVAFFKDGDVAGDAFEVGG